MSVSLKATNLQEKTCTKGFCSPKCSEKMKRKKKKKILAMLTPGLSCVVTKLHR